MRAKIGIYSGTFDPVHAGHIAFALQAVDKAGLDKVYFMPEQNPRNKSGITHYAHRISMLEIALRFHQKLDIIDLTDRRFTIKSTLPKIKKMFEGSQLYMLMGTDVADILIHKNPEHAWPGYKAMISNSSLIIGARSTEYLSKYNKLLQASGPDSHLVLTSKFNYSSSSIRSELMSGSHSEGLLKSISQYVNKNWLYTSVDSMSSSECA